MFGIYSYKVGSFAMDSHKASIVDLQKLERSTNCVTIDILKKNAMANKRNQATLVIGLSG